MVTTEKTSISILKAEEAVGTHATPMGLTQPRCQTLAHQRERQRVTRLLR
jgi:hypothetical protein